MTLTANTALLIGAFSLTLVGCGSKVDETGEPTDTSGTTDTTDTTDTTTTTTTGDDTALYFYFWQGSATVNNDGTDYTDWDGTESFAYYNITEGSLACTETYTMLSDTPLAGCDDCAFAFDVTMSDSMAAGDGCATFGVEDQSGETGTVGWGFAATTEMNDTTYNDVLMYYYPGDATWFAVAYATVAPQGDGMTIDYEINGQYFYYYTY
jgi:hypothetical protein